MATTTISMFRLITILSITIIPLVLIQNVTSAFTTDSDIEDGEDYIVDVQSLGSGIDARFQPKRIKKGARCDAVTNNICDGISVNKGTGLLRCCKKHCRNVLGDRNNCGSCGVKASFGSLCCQGESVNVAYNVTNCGKCGVKCSLGLKCEYGNCGYA